MELTLYVDQQERTVRFREVHALAAGDIYNPLTLDGVDGADTPTLELRLYRRPSDESPVAVASGFSEVPGHRRRRRATMVLSTTALSEWYEDLASEIASPEPAESGRPASSMPSLAANVWLVVSDATRQWANCVVPILLRRITPVIEHGADGVSPTVEIVKDGRATRIRITDVNGTHEAVILDGEDGEDGEDGASTTLEVGTDPGTGNRVLMVETAGSAPVAVPLAPDLTGETFDMECNDWRFRQALAKIWSRLGGTVEHEEDL